ncbi:MAG: hydantoinase B/oxoprolinase family protein [Rhodospirillales bacterium]|jgi:N-methylhydantoinase B|nr:hydantoinase B/oxoprolinase family protein [Rhodospirillales bacterium]MDP6645867.1 hydantoinase B/oxoprolinase family protein [Rhodospirillales bacterium]
MNVIKAKSVRPASHRSKPSRTAKGKPAKRAKAIDPITFEVIRHKLQAIVEEQAITLKAISGSPVVTEANDFNCGLYLADGSIVVMGPQIIFHTGTMSTIVRSIIQDSTENPGIHEGDMFILNDPYRGAIHQPDISIVAPIFHDGRHIAWAGACAHQIDTGGMNFGSWAYAATEVQQEAMLLPGVKLVERGELREDLWRMILGMSRLPQVIGLDLKAMIAANNVAIQRLGKLMNRYGAGTVEKVMNRELDTSENRLRARLKEIPDGVYRARDFIDHDGHDNILYHVCVTVEKRGDSMVLDLYGTSDQCPGFINSTYSGTKGALIAGFLPILAPDIRWNEGVLRPITIRMPEASLCNASWPAPVSGATVSTAWIVTNATVAALSRMVGCLPAWACEGPAVTKGHVTIMTLAGRDRDGGAYGTMLMDSMLGGGGAYVDHDGLDGSSGFVIPRPAIANVEANEAHGPILYLFRSFMPDSAGAGNMRGGTSGALAITPHDADELHAMIIGHGVEVPNSLGIFGGMPGSCGYNLMRHGNEKIETLIENVTGTENFIRDSEKLSAKPGYLPLKQGEVLGYTCQGGGGYGDPVTRDPQSVATDIAEGHLSKAAAKAIYGVAVRAGAVDAKATKGARDAIRRQRLGGKKPRKPAAAEGSSALPGLRVSENRHTRCACGCDLAAPGADWKKRAVTREVDPDACGRHVHLHAELMLFEFACPDCAALLEVEVCRKGEAPLASIVLDP